MLRQSSSRNYRSKKLGPRHSLQALLFFAVGIWIVYQLTRSYGKRPAVVLETDDDDDAMDGAETVRRRLGRKGFVGFAGHIVVGVGSDGVGSEAAASSDDDPWSKNEDRGDGEEEDEAAGEADGTDDEEDEGIAGDEEDDDRDFVSQNSVRGSSEDELITELVGSDRATVLSNGGDDDGSRLHEPKELNSSAVPLAKATGSLQDAAASQQTNATGDAAEHSTDAAYLSGSSLKNASAVNLSLHDRGTAKNLVVSPAEQLKQRMESTMSPSRIIA
ncbi:hypothetical protein PR202_gb10793 [Eleusine coracana subsp. coracana]|uniref:Uncharacterized protein n=1 Tax=Eleusine coracana subsp. coracana TaxID=191504 RepID=A0AAV5ELE2_ELECO|nr:hypothetical protein QOZ80_3BG0259520 [Eleusine coracana subsp. coracana]GJN23168.1 hypothetical protein PR202_gb10793 [Eleusine coracana subsp. coracana]